MAALPRRVYASLDEHLAPVDAWLAGRYPGDRDARQPVHTVYVPADRFDAQTVDGWGAAALRALDEHGPLPGFSSVLVQRVVAKLRSEPIEDLRVDFEDGYGIRDDATEDAAAIAAASALRDALRGGALAGMGLRCKSLEVSTRHRAIRTLDVFLDAFGEPPDGFVITLPKVSAVEQVSAMNVLCGHLESAHGLPAGQLRFELQIETPQAVLGPDGAATVAKMIDAAQGRCTGLHYGTYDYSAALGVAARYQSMEHPVADHAKAVMQLAAAGTGVRISDGSTNVLPVGDTEAVRAAWALHARLVRRSLEHGLYQGWDLHPAQLVTRYAATYAFYRDGIDEAVARLERYRQRVAGGILDEPATARALTGFLLRALRCGAVDQHEVGVEVASLEERHGA